MAKKRNPVWSRDELILCLDLYRREGPAAGIVHRENLVTILNSIRFEANDGGEPWARNQKSVESKLGNFQYLDTGGEKGRSNYGEEDERIWNQYWGSPKEIEQAAEVISSGAKDIKKLALEQAGYQIAEAPEGRILTLTHQVRERNAKLIRDKKKSVLKSEKRLTCEVCKFDFAETYGERGEEFIECHHTVPVSQLAEGQKTKTSDLALLCANCHRMIHRRAPWLSLDELRSILKSATT